MPDQEIGVGVEVFTVYMDSGKKRWARLFFDGPKKRLRVRDLEEQPIICNLGTAEIRVLYQLISRSGEVFNKEQLILFGWPGRVVATGSLAQAIFNIRSFFGADGHGIIVTSPKAGYMFNSDFLVGSLSVEKQPVQELDVEINSADLAFTVDERTSKSFEGGGRKHVGVRLLRAVVFLFFLASLIYLLKPEFEILTRDPLRITRFNVGELDVEFIISLKKDIAAPLEAQIKNIPMGGYGKVLVRVHEKRYRVVCYVSAGFSSYTVPISVPLDYAVANCLSRAGGES